MTGTSSVSLIQNSNHRTSFSLQSNANDRHHFFAYCQAKAITFESGSQAVILCTSLVAWCPIFSQSMTDTCLAWAI